jgi:hypothetical protein
MAVGTDNGCSRRSLRRFAHRDVALLFSREESTSVHPQEVGLL